MAKLIAIITIKGYSTIMDVQKINLQHFANIKRWKQLDRTSSPQQCFFRLGHINPECNIDQEKGKANQILQQEHCGNVIETTSTVGISTKKGRLTDFYDGMIALAQTGIMTGYSVKDIQDLRTNANKLMPEECDFWTDISIIDYKEEKIADQALKNTVEQFHKGYVHTYIPGASDNMTIKDALENPLVRAEAQKHGISEKKIDETLKKITDVSDQTVDQIRNSNITYVLGKFAAYPAVYCIPPSTNKPTSQTVKKKLLRNNKNKKNTQAGGDSDTRVQFPKDALKKENYPIGGQLLQTIKIKHFLITGGILTALHCMPSGKLSCQSLTKFKSITQTTRDSDMTFIDHSMVPKNSSLVKEGYMNREETNAMILKIASLL